LNVTGLTHSIVELIETRFNLGYQLSQNRGCFCGLGVAQRRPEPAKKKPKPCVFVVSAFGHSANQGATADLL
jgi:hypothetical protein